MNYTGRGSWRSVTLYVWWELSDPISASRVITIKNPYPPVFLRPDMNQFDAGLGLSVGFVACSEANSLPMKSLVFAGHIRGIQPILFSCPLDDARSGYLHRATKLIGIWDELAFPLST